MVLANGLVHHWSWSDYPPLSSHLGLLEYFSQQHSAEWEMPRYSRLQTYALYKLYNIRKGESQRRVQCLRATYAFLAPQKISLWQDHTLTLEGIFK